MSTSRYNPAEVEQKWYSHWMDKSYFRSTPDDRTPYTIVMPPPNVTGVLHMGHMLNNTVQDILIRKARLDGKNACWVPGTDHASIATEAKVVQLLREKGIKKGDLTRPEFLDHAFEWKDKYGGIILEQLKKLGASCDWDRTRFTMEEKLSESVIKVFVDLYKKGKLYRGLRMTNWDPEALTVLSSEEVIFTEENSRLFYVKYLVAETDEYITVATTRPETIFGDTAIAVHPEDERYAKYHGKTAIVPIVGREIPIIADKYVVMDFGTGALKVTPAHDANDHVLGQTHKLETIDIFTPDAKIAAGVGFFEGQDRFVARKSMVASLEAAGLLAKTEDIRNKLGRSERTKAIVEPRLTMQWFLDMKSFASQALDVVAKGEVKFYPDHFFNMYKTWLEADNVKDWCISRQLWWGQQIPAYFFREEVFVAETAAEALEQAREKFQDQSIQLTDLYQDEDVVDTWFSSWLWPISVFDGFFSPDELKYYYPTQTLVTGWDIIFFWVARMIMAGYEWSPELIPAAAAKGKMPFEAVYFTGMVRDNKRQKMSKSLGNSPDALELINRYGADGVRFGLLSSSAAGNDIIFDSPFDPVTKTVLNESKLCEQGLNFCNKMWNALRLIHSWEVVVENPSNEQAEINRYTINWFGNLMSAKLERIEELFKQYRLSECIVDLYNFVWDDFCSWYLEAIKPAYGAPIDQKTLDATNQYFSQLMIVLHPFMPFVTEELWHEILERTSGEDCVIQPYPKSKDVDSKVLDQMEYARNLVAKARDIKSANGLKERDALHVKALRRNSISEALDQPGFKELVIKSAVLSDLSLTDLELEAKPSFIVSADQFYLDVEIEMDAEAERDKISKELEYQRGFVQSIQKKLSNERFVAGAPVDVVQKEQQKLDDGLARIGMLEQTLSSLN